MEAWGNAKTIRNNNSSRFGKFVKIFLSHNKIVGSTNTTYLLEKNRVVFQEKGERNYHVFYQVLFGLSPPEVTRLLLDEFKQRPEDVCYINQSGCLHIEGVDDEDDHRVVAAALKQVGFGAEEVDSLNAVIAGILHMVSENRTPDD